MQWMWKHNSTNNFTRAPIKPIDRHFLVCYYTIPDSDAPEKLLPGYIDPRLCSHVIIGFASVKNCSIALGNNLEVYRQVVDLKKQEPNLKVMVSVGGAASQDDNGFAEMVSNHSNRKM